MTWSPVGCWTSRWSARNEISWSDSWTAKSTRNSWQVNKCERRKRLSRWQQMKYKSKESIRQKKKKKKNSFLIYGTKLNKAKLKFLSWISWFKGVKEAVQQTLTGLTAGTKHRAYSFSWEDKYENAERQFSAGIRQGAPLPLSCADCSHKRIGFQSKSGAIFFLDSDCHLYTLSPSDSGGSYLHLPAES